MVFVDVGQNKISLPHIHGRFKLPSTPEVFCSSVSVLIFSTIPLSTVFQYNFPQSTALKN